VSRRRRNLETFPPEWTKQVRERRRGVLLSEVEKEEIVWLWEGRIPRGKITVLDGDPGLGKSAFTTDLAARVSVGRDFPDGSPCPEGGVVLMNAEDGLADTIRPRLDAAGGNPSRVLALAEIPDEERPDQDRVLSLPEDLDVLEEGIRRVDAALVVIDPLMAFLGGDTNAHKDQDIRRALASLKSLAERTGVAVVLVRHLNKGASGNPLYRGGGSIGIIGAARSGLLVASDPNDPEEKRRVLAGSKNNLAEMEGSVLFRVVTAANGAARVEYLGESGLGAKDLVRAPLDEEEKTAMDEATDFLREVLSHRPMAASHVFKEARQAGISEATLKRAKARLGLKSEKVGDNWVWPRIEDDRLNTHDPLDPLDPLGEKSADLQRNEEAQPRGSNETLDWEGDQGDQPRGSSNPTVDPLHLPANSGFLGEEDQEDHADTVEDHPWHCDCGEC
jgi:hypothetical protein